MSLLFFSFFSALIKIHNVIKEYKTRKWTYNNKNTKFWSKFSIIKISKLHLKFKTTWNSCLGNTKDKITMLKKFGIHKIECDSCEEFDLGQTRRKVETRFKEHLSHLTFKKSENNALRSMLCIHFIMQGWIMVNVMSNNKLLGSFDSILFVKTEYDFGLILIRGRFWILRFFVCFCFWWK